MKNDKFLQTIVEGVELPDRAYESAKRRYDDLADWFSRHECTLRGTNPHIFVQGSFALGTAIRPVREGDEYDLDLSCKLRTGIDRSTNSQRELKETVGRELEAYRRFRTIERPLEPKNRCWRLNYRDDLRFHLDVVPAIPADSSRRGTLTSLMERHGIDRRLASDIASDSLWITDKRHPGFDRIQDDWLSSNPEGYVRWFVSRMTDPHRALKAEAKVDDIPLYRRKSPLQRSIQLLKSHRDIMFLSAAESKPISVIITTIAGQAYVPGQSIADSLSTILQALEDFRRSNSDVVPNPVNPEENFADRWKLPDGRRNQLKENFHRWIIQARADFDFLLTQTDPQQLVERAKSRVGVSLSEATVISALGLERPPAQAPSVRHVNIHTPPRPWSRNE